ncbi:MAG TPA: matrixin family metalloprotease [Patescibacteria group bacterium]|nr:matrixin family metalloprotease [Patescibacteria group bacterium]
MKLSRVKFFVGICAVLLLLGFGYYYMEDDGRFLRGFLNRLQPCQVPITYSIADFDSRFGLTEAELLNNVKNAEKIWESAINKELFEYSPAGNLKINFIYDYRQKATDELRKIGIIINDDQSTYYVLKTKHDLLVDSYNKEKIQLENLIAIYNADKDIFEEDVNYWNSRGGAPRTEYNILEQKKVDLNNQVIIINQAENSLNELFNTINLMEIVLNKLIITLNFQVSKYNTIGLSTGKEFSEGEYVSDVSGTLINIFQFNDTNQLVTVLAHEFGHALGLGHLDNSKAIMYYLNEGVNETLTADDIAAIKKVCGIK